MAAKRDDVTVLTVPEVVGPEATAEVLATDLAEVGESSKKMTFDVETMTIHHSALVGQESKGDKVYEFNFTATFDNLQSVYEAASKEVARRVQRRWKTFLKMKLTKYDPHYPRDGAHFFVHPMTALPVIPIEHQLDDLKENKPDVVRQLRIETLKALGLDDDAINIAMSKF